MAREQCWSGVPILWGLAVGGEAGVKFVLEMLRQEFDLAVALLGCPRLTAITEISSVPCSNIIKLAAGDRMEGA